jgi:uncharacterized protein (TIGR04255 family)
MEAAEGTLTPALLVSLGGESRSCRYSGLEAEALMLFPDSGRVVYKKNPLTEVICQLRFPPILRIDTELPAMFQEKVREQYPLYQEAAQQTINFPELPKQLARVVGEMGLRRSGKAHDFLSADEGWKVGLTREFLAVSTSRYERWEQFIEHLTGPLEALLEIYSPPFFTRVGLRYQNVIQRSALELQETPWSELLKPHILGELAYEGMAEATAASFTQTLLRQDELESQVHIRHGLAFYEDSAEQNYAIDSDFFSDQKTEPSNVFSKLTPFNAQAGRLFRWCITDRLHNAREPQPL